MTEQTTAEATPSANGSAPPEPEAIPEDGVTGGEKAMAVVAALFGAFIFLMAIDMFTGGRVSGSIAERAAGD